MIMTNKELRIQSYESLLAKEKDDSVKLEWFRENGKWGHEEDPDYTNDERYEDKFYYRLKQKKKTYGLFAVWDDFEEGDLMDLTMYEHRNGIAYLGGKKCDGYSHYKLIQDLGHLE